MTAFDSNPLSVSGSTPEKSDSQNSAKYFSDGEGYLHARSNDFGKSPISLIHDKSITDGACRLYAHMHWRYGSNCKNIEGRGSMSSFFGVSETTITNRVKELVARDWVVTVPRTDEHGKTHNFYHVFETQADCLSWRQSHNKPKESVKVTPRKTRQGIGGSKTHKPKDGSSTQVDHPDSELKLPSDLNSSSHYPDSGDPDSFHTKTLQPAVALPQAKTEMPEILVTTRISAGRVRVAERKPFVRGVFRAFPKSSAKKVFRRNAQTL